MNHPTEPVEAAALGYPEPLVFRTVERRGFNRGPDSGADRRRDPDLGGRDLAADEHCSSRQESISQKDLLLAEAVSAEPNEALLAAREDAHAQGLRDGMALAEAQLGERVAQERQGVVEALEGFVRERQLYFAGLEREVVRLSLAIAERVLHRESSMDPTLLAGAARVALQQVEDDSTAVLRTSPAEVHLWQGILEREGRSVEVCADATLGRGQCMLQAATGSIELGVRSQLAEIEHGFFELLGRNPAMAA